MYIYILETTIFSCKILYQWAVPFQYRKNNYIIVVPDLYKELEHIYKTDRNTKLHDRDKRNKLYRKQIIQIIIIYINIK